jgi:YggT family protein
MSEIVNFVVEIVLLLIDLYTVLLFVRLFTTSRDRYDSVLGLVFQATDPMVLFLNPLLGIRYAAFAPLLLICGFVALKFILFQSLLAALSMVLRIYNFYMILLFVRVFATLRDRNDPVLGLIFRMTDVLVIPLTGTLSARFAAVVPFGLIAMLIILEGVVFFSMAQVLLSFMDVLLQLYCLAFLILFAYRELYIHSIASLGQRLIRPVQTVFSQLSSQQSVVNVLSIVGLIVIHSIATLVILEVLGTGLLRAPTPPVAVIRSLGVVVNLLQFFIAVIIIMVVLSWVSRDPQNPFIELLDMLSSPIMTPIRNIFPPLGGVFDLTPMLAIFLLVILNRLGHQVLGLVRSNFIG